MLVVVVTCLVANAALFGLERYQADAVQQSAVDLAGWRALTSKQESGQVTQTTRQLNATVAGLQSLFAPLSTEAATTARLIASLPSDITVTSLKIIADASFTLTGTAATRSSFLALRTALDNNPLVTKVATDSTASLREKIPFEFTGQLVIQP